MKTIHKLFLIATIALGLGFVACNDADDVPLADDSNTNTHVSVTLKLSTGASTRAGLPDDYNKIGEWAGKDKIEKITIYLVDASLVTSKSFDVGKDNDYEVVTNAAGDITVVPKKDAAAIKTTAGEKTVYALINGTDDVIAHLNKAPVAEFEDAYQKVALKLANVGNATTSTTSASKLAVKNGVDNETIVMTNVKPATLTLVANVTANETITDATKNRLSLNVERAVARVMVTTKQDTYNVPDPKTDGASNLGVISNITWVAAQGENSLYVQRKSDWATPNYGWVPSATGADNNFISQAGSKYDYSGLFENYNTGFGGTTVPTWGAYAGAIGDITGDLAAQLSGKFILPNTHAAGEKAKSSYKKGNTAYVLIRANFAPANGAYADGGSYVAGADFFVGANGKFYTSATNAVNPAKGGVAGQTVARYKKGKVLYYAWVNPDNVPDWYNSPVLRNNIYHIHITGFKNLGTNWNPLFPANPDIPGDPATGGNPDPKPTVNTGDPEEPTNPIDPNDPLTTSETWMSVDVKVLPWKIHSYSVDLGM